MGILSKERALVLGGGGASGNAWLIGVIAGLFDAGLDITDADLIIGTSAGSTAAAQITSVSKPTELFTKILSYTPVSPTSAEGSNSSGVSYRPAINHMETTSALISTARDAAEMRRKMGAWALATDGASDNSVQARWRATVAARLPGQHWPQRSMLIPAVNAHTGEPVVFDRNSGVDLVDAIAASCAGGFAYSIGDKQYIDGGYRADLNADLAAGYKRVLIIPPLGDKTRKPLSWKLHLAAQVDELRTGGSKVEVIFPDSNSQSALAVGMRVMDLSTRRPSAEAGYSQGKVLAKELIKFWR